MHSITSHLFILLFYANLLLLIAQHVYLQETCYHKATKRIRDLI